MQNSSNLLPRDGIVLYTRVVFTPAEAAGHFDSLSALPDWRHDETVIFGKRIVTSRMVAWYGDHPFEYTHSRITRRALPWPPAVLALKAVAEMETGETYNSCLLNLYHNGSEGMGWHSDNEPELKKEGAICSLSFGADRKFSFKHKQTGEKVDILLENGSLLLMKGSTQAHWLHRLPPAKKILTPRINLTFRTIAR
ncbi:MAG: alpha-ketoglutarate-dependent dioxygenase AlkB [Saprospiraceae bacterium]|nr:alpha-ketoglutarate-dependent dioxygenase AlkB [Saprospiraceae bacterium]